MKNQKDLYFIRYGHLNPVKHKEHRFKDDWHVAPRVKGIYAFQRTKDVAKLVKFCKFSQKLDIKMQGCQDFLHFVQKEIRKFGGFKKSS